MTSGALNISIDEYTSPISLLASEDMKVNEIIGLMEEKKVRHIPVVKENIPVGIISDRDLNLINFLKSGDVLVAKDIMVPDPYCVPIGALIDEVAFEMSSRKIGSALVVNKEGALEGIFTSIDGLNALIEIVRGDVETV